MTDNVYCVVEPDGYPGDFDGEAYVTPPEDRVEFIKARSARLAKAEFARRFHTDVDGLRAHKLDHEDEAAARAEWEFDRLCQIYENDPVQGPRREFNWHTDDGRYENVWFAHRTGDSGNCAAVDLRASGWQFLIYDRNGTHWFVRDSAFYPSREEAQKAAEEAASTGVLDQPLRLMFPWEEEGQL